MKWNGMLSLLGGVLLMVAPMANAEESLSTSQSQVVAGLVEVLAQRAGDNLKVCQAHSDRTNGLYGGYFTMSGQVCSTTMSFNVRYVGFAPSPGWSATGNATMSGSVDSPYYPSRMTLSFNSGPIIYDYYGQRFNVQFQNVTFVYRIWYGGATLSSVSGGVLINGSYVPVNRTLAGFIY